MFFVLTENHAANCINTPAAIVDPITPATFGPIACIIKKLSGSDSIPTLLATRAAIGTAETPAAPIKGLILFLENRFISFAISTPVIVPIPNATIPKPNIPRVSPTKNSSATNLEPTDKPRNMVAVLIKAFCAVSDRRATTRHSFIKLPKQNIPSRGAAPGTINATSNNNTRGKRTFSV